MAIDSKLMKKLLGLAADKTAVKEITPNFTEKLEFEAFIEHLAKHEDVDDEESFEKYIDDNLVDNAKMRANHTQSQVRMVRAAASGNGFVLTLANGAELWSGAEAVPGDTACYFTFKKGAVRKFWNTATQEVDGYSICLNAHARLITTQKMDAVAFEAAVRALGVGAPSVVAPVESGTTSLF